MDNRTQARKASAAATAAVRAYRKAQAQKTSPKDLLGPIAGLHKRAKQAERNPDVSLQEVYAIAKGARQLLNQAQNMAYDRQSDPGGWVDSIISGLAKAGDNRVLRFETDHPNRAAGWIATGLEAAYNSARRWAGNRI